MAEKAQTEQKLTLEKFEQAYPDAFKANVKMPPMGHYGDVEKEIGRVCVQLASPDFKFMTARRDLSQRLLEIMHRVLRMQQRHTV